MLLSTKARGVYIGEGRLAAKGLSSCLSEAGHEFLTACFNPEAVDGIVEQHQPTIIVIGPLRPRWLAFDLCRNVVNRWPAIRVIIATRDAGDDLVAADALFVGANACVDTRIDPDDLVQVIERVLLGARLLSLDQWRGMWTAKPC